MTSELRDAITILEGISDDIESPDMRGRKAGDLLADLLVVQEAISELGKWLEELDQ
jgi:hypothetical protein